MDADIINMASFSLHLIFGYILIRYWILAEYDLRCMQNDSISNLQEFTNYIKECQVFLQDVLKRLPLHANADYVGCFESSGKSLGVYSALNSSKMSIDKCIQNCKHFYLSYAGIQNGSQCLCGIMETDFIQIKESRCSIKCPTDFRLYCGGERSVQLYYTKPVKKDCDPRAMKGNFVGCLADDKLPLLSGNVSESQNMRVQNCLELCEKSRYFYAGLKKTNICLCGNDTIKINASSEVYCQLRCAGNLSQCCGGVQHLQLYRTSIPLPTRFPEWHTKACFCGASVPENGRVADFNCDSFCTGNRSQFCGGQESDSTIFLQVYEIKDSLPFISTEGMFLGCHVGSVDDLEQMKIVTNDKKLTIDICLQHCQKKGLKFAAIEKGSQCACGQLYDNLRKTSNFECNLPCPGNPVQVCGGSRRVQIHSIKIFAKRFTPYGIYLGCFQSIPSEMNHNHLQDTSMTLDICIKHCWEKGLLYAALKQGNACFCGKKPSAEDLKISDSQCNIECSSDDGNFCGGTHAFQIYHVEYLLRKFFGQSSISMPTDLTWA